MNNELSLGGKLAKAATELLNSIDHDSCYDVEPLKEALEAWAMDKPAAQHQGEPVAWEIDTPGHPWNCKVVRREDVAEEYADKIRAEGERSEVYPLYRHPAEQPAPVAVVLPNDQLKNAYTEGFSDGYESGTERSSKGFNKELIANWASSVTCEALDDVARRNNLLQ